METAQVEKHSATTQPASLSWSDSPSVQRLLDVVVSIIAEEYVQVAKQNREIFSDNGGEK